MGKFHTCIADAHATFIKKQHMFFVATYLISLQKWWLAHQSFRAHLVDALRETLGLIG